MDANLPKIQYAMQPDASELATQFISLISISLLCLLFGLKTFNVQYKYLTYSRWLVIALYVQSWAFVVTAILLVSTNNGKYSDSQFRAYMGTYVCGSGNSLSCVLSEMACDVFYAGTKIIIYFWYYLMNTPFSANNSSNHLIAVTGSLRKCGLSLLSANRGCKLGLTSSTLVL